jgi:hypothetical protein
MEPASLVFGKGAYLHALDGPALWSATPAALLCPDCGSRRCACCRPDPRRPASAPGSRPRGRAATLVDADLAPGPDETRNDGDDDRGLLLFTGAGVVGVGTFTTATGWPICAARTTCNRRPRRAESLLPASAMDELQVPGATVGWLLVGPGKAEQSIAAAAREHQQQRGRWTSSLLHPRSMGSLGDQVPRRSRLPLRSRTKGARAAIPAARGCSAANPITACTPAKQRKGSSGADVCEPCLCGRRRTVFGAKPAVGRAGLPSARNPGMAGLQTWHGARALTLTFLLRLRPAR